jgi:hypothetical protein
VVLFEIDLIGVAIFKFERDTPRAVHMNGITCRGKTPQGVKLETGDAHLLRRRSSVETIQPSENAVVHLWGNPPGLPLLPEFRQRLALERLDHNEYVSSWLTAVNAAR